MSLQQRYLRPQIESDLETKMVFVAGPRQVGKTTLAKSLPGAETGYLSWDDLDHRTLILSRDLPRSPLWIFDEIHKYRSWRNHLKGLFDTRAPNQKILVTGSARLDLYRYSGDSLQGRYFMLRLHPLSVAELGIETKGDFNDLLTLGGFPEPFYGASKQKARRWSSQYRSLLIHQELTSLEQVVDLGNLELLALRLPELVGSPLSINSLREQLQLGHHTVAKWLSILERLYGLFRLSPFGPPKIRAIKKSQKHYHFDWNVVTEPGPRFENLVACHLLKWVHYQQDTEGRDLELRYFRDVLGNEVDFVVLEGLKPILFAEAKLGDAPVNKALYTLQHRYRDAEAWQISATGKKDYQTGEGIRVAPALEFLRSLV